MLNRMNSLTQNSCNANCFSPTTASSNSAWMLREWMSFWMKYIYSWVFGIRARTTRIRCKSSNIRTSNVLAIGRLSKYSHDCEPVWGQPREVPKCLVSTVGAQHSNSELAPGHTTDSTIQEYHQSQDEWLHMKGHDLNLVNPTPFKFQGEILLRHNPEPERTSWMLRCCG